MQAVVCRVVTCAKCGQERVSAIAHPDDLRYRSQSACYEANFHIETHRTPAGGEGCGGYSISFDITTQEASTLME